MTHLPANEIVGTTFYTIDKILGSGKNGPDALALYFKYIEQSRIQNNNITYSLDFFMAKKMLWNIKTFYKVKKILQGLGLIDTISKIGPDGKKDSWYVRVNFIINEDKVRNCIIDYDMGSTLPGNGIVDSTLPENHTTTLPHYQKTVDNTFIPNTNTFIPNIYTFEKFWNLYNKKIGDKQKAEKIRNTLKEEERIKIIDILPDYLLTVTDKQFQPYPTTYLYQRRRENDIILPKEVITSKQSDTWRFEKMKKEKLEGLSIAHYKETLGEERYNKLFQMWREYRDTDLFTLTTKIDVRKS